MKTKTIPCSRCSGRGYVGFTRLAEGICFGCKGSGQIAFEECEIAARRMPRAKVIEQIHRVLIRMELAAGDYESADLAFVGTMLAHADDDVVARTMAALDRMEDRSPRAWRDNLLARERAAETERLAIGVRRQPRNVRAAG